MTFMFFIVAAGLAAGGIGYFLHTQSRKRLREDKAIERGLKMVPMLIHLPPSSEDIDVGARDIRDVTDETISKAQIIYNILASTAQKGFKARKYGQRHISFEIVGKEGFVHFYALVPVAMVEVVQQAVVSAYPAARLEEVQDHNIFNSAGGINTVVGGEFEFKEHFAYPIATYQDLKRDAMQALFNALSSLDKEDGVGVQYLIRPADPSWRKAANDRAAKRKEGKDKGKGGFADELQWWLKQLPKALAKPPEPKDDKSKELSSIDQSIVDAMHDKTRSAGFEVSIRVVASSNIHQRSQALLNNVTASFALFDAPGKNGFKFNTLPPDDLARDFILRAFPLDKRKMIMNTVELATLFHFPDQNNTPTSQLERQESKQVDGPRNMPDEGLLLGYNVFRGIKKPVRLGLSDRQRHMYAVGQTGTGKSTFLENLALQDMLSGGGFAFVDPHGDTAEKLLSMVPKERTEDVIYFCPSDMEYPMGLNLFEYDDPDEKDFLIQEVINMLYKLYDPQRQGIMGPRYENIFRNAALAVMADPAGGTFVDVPKLFRDPDFLKRKLQHVQDPNVLDYWQKEYPASQRSNEAGEVTAWFVSKFGAFLSNAMMRNIIGQTKSAFNLREIMDNKKILIVNLSKGRTGDLNSKLLGMIFVMKFQAAAMSRANIPEKDRVDFALYVDEFQNFSTDSFATIMSEARKYHLNLIVANQFTTQLTEEIRDAVFGNMGTIVAYRIGQNDVDALSRYFQPQFDSDDLLRVPNYNAIVRTLVGGVPTQPFSMAALPPLGNANPKLAVALKQLSAAKYGRPRAKIEEEIFERLKTQTPPAPSFGSRPTFGQPTAGQSPFAAQGQPGMAQTRPAPAAQKPPGTGSFLDEWLTKKQSPAAPYASNARPPVQPQPTMPASTPAAMPQPSVAQPGTQPVAQPVVQQPATQPAAQPASQPLAPLQPAASPVVHPPVSAPQPTFVSSTAPAVPAPQQQSASQAIPPVPTPTPATPAVAPSQAPSPQTQPAIPATTHEGEVVLREKKAQGQQETEKPAGGEAADEEQDIFIDQEGNFNIDGIGNDT